MESRAFFSSEVFVPHLPLEEKGKRESVYRVGVYPFILWHSNEIHCCLKNNEGKMQVNYSRQFLGFVRTDKALDRSLCMESITAFYISVAHDPCSFIPSKLPILSFKSKERNPAVRYHTEFNRRLFQLSLLLRVFSIKNAVVSNVSGAFQ